MPALTPDAIASLLEPYLPTAPSALCAQLSTYLDLLLKWNARTNLTAIRSPEEIVRRHFGESLFAAQHLGPCTTLLDFGSGAGFPGLPIQLFDPRIFVTLAESQNKKAAFLREAIRTLNLTTEVWPSRVESMPAQRQFDVVTLRAVEKMDEALASSASRARHRIALLTTTPPPLPPADFRISALIALPNSTIQHLLLCNRV